MKRQFSPKEKAEVALSAIKGQLTMSQISSTYQVHPTQIGLWKKQAVSGLTEIFSDKRKKDNQSQEQLVGELYKIIGQKDTEVTWIKKKFSPFNSS